MADMTANDVQTRESLGVGSIIGESFSIFFKRILQILILGFVISFAALMLSLLFVGPEMITGGMAAPSGVGFEPMAPVDINPMGMVMMMLINVVAYGILIGAFVLLAYDAKLDRSARTGAYITSALKNILPILVLTIVAYIAIVIGLMLLVVPGLWVYAVLSVFIPAIVIEGAGFGALGRSAALTKGYRWPILGLLVVMGIIVFVVSFVLAFLVAMPLTMLGAGSMGAIAAQAIGSGISYGLGAIPVALVYARLREIKEGVTVDSLADVFS